MLFRLLRRVDVVDIGPLTESTVRHLTVFYTGMIRTVNLFNFILRWNWLLGKHLRCLRGCCGFKSTDVLFYNMNSNTYQMRQTHAHLEDDKPL